MFFKPTDHDPTDHDAILRNDEFFLVLDAILAQADRSWAAWSWAAWSWAAWSTAGSVGAGTGA